MSMYMDKIKRMLKKELENIADKSELSAADVVAIQEITSSIKNICRIHEMEEHEANEVGLPMYSEEDRKALLRVADLMREEYGDR